MRHQDSVGGAATIIQGLELVNVQEEERDGFKRMCLSLFPVKYSENFYNRLFCERDYFTFFIKHRSTYIGMCSVCIRMKEAYLLVFGIFPDFRGKMIGTASLRLLEEFILHRAGARILSLHVHSANLRATHFYLSNGYAPDGTVENYYNEMVPRSAHTFYKVLQ